MQKKTIEKEVGEPINISKNDTLEIEALVSQLNDLKYQGATHVGVDAETGWDAEIESIEMQAISITIESDESFNSRVRKEKQELQARIQHQEECELLLYQKLKEKFEPGASKPL